MHRPHHYLVDRFRISVRQMATDMPQRFCEQSLEDIQTHKLMEANQNNEQKTKEQTTGYKT